MGFASRKLLVKSKKSSAPLPTPTTGDLYWSDAVLLLHGEGSNNQSNNSFIDSANSLTITRNGSVTQGSFTPFLNNFAYDPLIHGGSAYFNGTTDYLTNYTSGAATATTFGTQNFTIEAWINFNSATGNQGICDASNQIGTGTAAGQFFFYKTATGLVFGNHNIGNLLTYNWTPVVGTWYHVAVSRSGTSLKMFINGAEVASATNSTNFTGSGINIGVIATPYYFNGYISNLRITKGAVGAALYTSNFTPPTSPVTLTSNGGATPSTAPTSGQVSLLCDFTNAGIIDHAKKNNLTTIGDAKVSTSVKKYGSGSIYFDGTGDYLRILNNNNLNFGSENFTIETWCYNLNVTNTVVIYSHRLTNIPSLGILIGVSAGYYVLYISTGSNVWQIQTTTAAVASLNTWEHIALVRSGNTFTFYKNGTNSYSSSTAGSISNDGADLVLGGNAQSPNVFYNGYIDDLRITKGVARYTSNFTPPGPLPDGPSTVLVGLELNDFSGYIVQEDSSYILLDT